MDIFTGKQLTAFYEVYVCPYVAVGDDPHRVFSIKLGISRYAAKRLCYRIAWQYIKSPTFKLCGCREPEQTEE